MHTSTDRQRVHQGRPAIGSLHNNCQHPQQHRSISQQEIAINIWPTEQRDGTQLRAVHNAISTAESIGNGALYCVIPLHGQYTVFHKIARCEWREWSYHGRQVDSWTRLGVPSFRHSCKTVLHQWSVCLPRKYYCTIPVLSEELSRHLVVVAFVTKRHSVHETSIQISTPSIETIGLLSSYKGRTNAPSPAPGARFSKILGQT